MGTRIGGGPNAPGYEYVTNVLCSLLPMAEKIGKNYGGEEGETRHQLHK